MKHSPYLIWNFLIGLSVLGVIGETARASSLILAKAKQVPQNTSIPLDEIVPIPISLSEVAGLNETLEVATNTSKLTGVPQLDYVHDPNLPRELNGYNLTDYPFYNSIPEEIDFKCDGLHDGFYASVLHKCQVYHHCLFGTRYDFLCANYTAFDQKTFICHFASEVDCKNSPKYFIRNEALYKQATTTTVAPPTSAKPPPGEGNGQRRRPFRRRKPQYDYYDDYGDYGDDYAEDDRRSKRPRTQSKESDSTEDESLPSGPNKSLYDRPRVAPKVRRPVPVNERDKYDYSGDSRVISTKAPPPAEPSPEEEEKTEKRKNKPRTQDSSGESGKGKDRERYRDRYRGRDEEEDEEEGGKGDKDRGRGRESGEVEDERDRSRLRGEEDRERSRPRDEDRDRPRNRRPAKKRKRPDNYEYYDEYEDVRPRPKQRDRPRYEDDDDYDDRYYRKPLRSRDRDRDWDRERDRERYRSRDEEERRSKPKNNDKPSRHREYDDEEDDERYAKKPEDKKQRDKNEGRGRGETGRYYEDDEEVSQPKKQQETGASNQKDAIEPTPKKQERGRKSEKPAKEESVEGNDEDTSEEKPKLVEKEKIPESPKTPRPNFLRKTYTTTPKPVPKQEELPEEPPLPAPRPAYITTPPKSVKKQPEIPARRPSGFRRQSTQKYSAEDLETQKEETSMKDFSSERVPETSVNNERKNSRPDQVSQISKPAPSKPEKSNTRDQDLKVPYEDAADEDLAPRAPKAPVMSNKRRPFLPSRGGDPTLLRGLTPVGAKAFTAPKKEEERIRQEVPIQPQPVSRERVSNKGSVGIDPKFPTGIEFRTRVQANVGVEQPRLTPSVQEDTSAQDEDYSGEVESEESRREDSQNFETQRKPVQRVKFSKEDAVYRAPISSERPVASLRPTLKPVDFSRTYVNVQPVQTEIVQNSQENKDRKYSSRLPQTIENKPILSNTQYFSEVSQQKQTGFQQFGPQTFFSDNPKFQTTVPLIEPQRPRPTQTNLNYNQGTQIPSFYQPVIKPGQGQVQIVHFQKNSPIEYTSTSNRKPAVKFPQPENLEDTDEYDVSFNDALQPLSSLHPRNAQTGLLNSQRVSAQIPSRRRLSAPSAQNNGAQRFAESVVQPQFAVPNPVFRNFHSEFYSAFSN